MFADTGINWLGIGSIVVFYLLILGVGMWAAAKKGGDDLDQEVRFPESSIVPFINVCFIKIRTAHKSIFINLF